MNKKDRRASGWTYGYSTLRAPKKYIIDNCLEPQPYWDNWNDYRDGFRDYLRDRSRIKSQSLVRCYSAYQDGIFMRWASDRMIKSNRKNKKLLLRRKKMKRKVYIPEY